MALEVLNKIDYCERELNYVKIKADECQSNIDMLQQKKALILAAKEFHRKAIDILYKSSVRDLEELLNDVISAVFYDRNLEVRMELTDSRSKALVWSVFDKDLDVEMSVRDEVGRGVRAVLSFILQSYYVLSFGSKVMFIDEGYSVISEAYVGKFFEFVKLLCMEKDLSLVMISHDNRFTEHATKHYHVIAGSVQEIEDRGVKK